MHRTEVTGSSFPVTIFPSSFDIKSYHNKERFSVHAGLVALSKYMDRNKGKKSLPGANKVSLSAGRGAGPWPGLARPRGGALVSPPRPHASITLRSFDERDTDLAL